MFRKFTHIALSAVFFCSVSCNDDDVSSPPKSAFQANKSSAEVEEPITFTVNQVSADAISLLPYGYPGSDGGVLITSFTNGTAVVEFKYEKPGTFQAVVVSNNHSSDGESVKNVVSEPITITITSSKNSISEFSFKDVTGETEIDQDNSTIDVTVPYGTDITKLKAVYSASGFSTVSVGGTAQSSGETQNDFSSPKTYTVTANNGTTRTYTVTVHVTPIEQISTIKSLTATAMSKSADEKPLGVHIDNVAGLIVVYDTLGTSSTQYDSVEVAYELNGEFAILKSSGKVLDQDTVLNLVSPREFQVYSQDSASAGGIQTFNVYTVSAPKLMLSFPDLNPDPAVEVKPENFNIGVNVLVGTDESDIKTAATVTTPAGVTVTNIRANDMNFVSGSSVDYSDPVEFEITVNDSNLGISYTVVYTVTVTAVP